MESTSEKTKSRTPKNAAVNKLMPMTIMVCLVVSFLVGHDTFFNSRLDSIRYLTSLVSLKFIFFDFYYSKKAFRPSADIIHQIKNNARGLCTGESCFFTILVEFVKCARFVLK